MTIGLTHYLILSGALFSLGLLAVLTWKNAIRVLMGLELMLNSANINLVAFSRYSTTGIDGQILAVFVIVVAAAEVAIALAIVLSMFRMAYTVNLDRATRLRG